MSNSSNDNFSDITGVVLAGGLGTRLRPTVSYKPKVMANVNGRPFLTYLLDQLEDAGLHKVVLCTGYMADAVSKEIGDTYKSLKIIYSKEDDPLGTAGAIKLAVPHLDSEYILVMNGDSYIDTDLNNFLNWHVENNCSASILLTKVNDISRYGKVVVAEDGQIVNFEEKGGESGPGWINAGVYLLDKETLKYLPQETPSSMEKQFFPALAGKGLYGFQSKGEFFDIGTPESYAKAELFFSQRLGSRGQFKG